MNENIKYYGGILMRKIIVAGNWKMNKTTKETEKFFTEFKPLVAGVKNVETIKDTQGIDRVVCGNA